MTIMFAFEEEVIKAFCAYMISGGRGRSDSGMYQYYKEMDSEWDLQNLVKWFLI